ncbi:hypothetical protein [Nonomuraea sp. GTA35]|uniref:hypothetical protein n=1 Tax=Nonomuraea sp. GTA35 TaxID=1676746 RepID=UPI0035BFA6AC
MMTPEPDLQQRLLDAMRREEENPSTVSSLLDPFQYVASANYVVPMLLDLAIERGNEIVDHVPAYSSLDHAANWQNLIAAIRRFEDFTMPYFNHALFPDPFAEELLAYEFQKRRRQHIISSFQQDLWRLMSDEGKLRVSLAKPVRRSALHLVSHMAEHASHTTEVAAMLKLPGEEMDLSELTLALDISALKVFSESSPQSWDLLCAGLDFPMEMLPSFRAWFVYLAQTSVRRWFTIDELWADWTEFTDRRGIECQSRQYFEAIVNLHALTPSEAESWGCQAPFLRCGEFLAVWFFAFHALPPDLIFLTLLTRRYDRLWSTTIGSTLASAADWLGSQLPTNPRLAWAARKRFRDVGDADLILWDRHTDDIVVLELKTTYDKFRSHFQLRNYIDQRVNFSKATSQAKRVAEAITQGTWSMRDIFGKAAPKQPRSVTPAVLTWWDTFNPTLGTENEILCCNFSTFAYIATEAEGNLNATVTTIRELTMLFCPGQLHPMDISLDGQQRTFFREVQGAELPPSSYWGDMAPLTVKLLMQLSRWPSDWDNHVDDGAPLFIYDSTM